TVQVAGGGGAGDRAYMYDSSGNDTFTGRPEYSFLSGAGFNNYVSGFGHVYAYATSGDAGGVGDRVNLYDSAGNDTLGMPPAYALLQGTNLYNYAQGFGRAYAFATAGDAGGVGDRAALYDSAGNDTFVGTPSYGLLLGSNFYNYAQGFDSVTAVAIAGG